MSKTATAYTIRNKKSGEFLATGGSRNVKNLAAARFWATEAGAQGWLEFNTSRAFGSYDSFDTQQWVKENKKDAEVVPVKLKVEV